MERRMHTYSHAIMGITEALPGEKLECKDYGEINFEALRNEVDGYKRVLRELNIQVIEIVTRGNIHNKLAIEELAVVCQGTAVIPRHSMSTPSTINSKILHQTLSECGMTVIVQEHYNPAKLSPQDVLFTGREFFVGISEYTNEAGANMIAEAFPEFPCTPIKMPLHSCVLKKYITVVGPDVLSVGGNGPGLDLIRKIERESNFSYHTLTVPSIDASNCVFVNNTLLHKGIEDIGDNCFKVFCDKIDFPRRSLKFTELNKIRLDPSAMVMLVNLP